MTCEEIRQRLSEYLDGECDKSEDVAKHLEGCPECQREYERLVTLSKSFENFVEESEKSVADSVVATIRGEKMKKTPFFVRHIGLAASLVLILVLVLYTRLFPYNAKEESAEIGAPSGETVTLKAEILDIKNSANLKGDLQFAISDASPRDDVEIEETAPEAPMEEAFEAEEPKSEPMESQPVKSGSFKDIQNEAPVLPECDSVFEYVFLESDGSNAFAILLSEFEVEQIDSATFHVKTQSLERVKELVGDNAQVYFEDGVVVVKIK